MDATLTVTPPTMTDNLFAEGNLEFHEAKVTLAELPATFIGRQPTPAMIESVRQLGILQPVLVHRNDKGGLDLLAGRRRVQAARAVGMTLIQARYVSVKGGWSDMSEVVTLAENRYREANQAAEAMAVRELVTAGHSPQVIRESLGMSKRAFQPIVELLALNPAIFTGFVAGEIKIGVARRIAKLSLGAQSQLAIRLHEAGKLKHSDVDAAIHTGTQSELPGMPAPKTEGGRGDMSVVLAHVPFLALLRAAEKRAHHETLRFLLGKAIALAQDEADEPVMLGDPALDAALSEASSAEFQEQAQEGVAIEENVGVAGA